MGLDLEQNTTPFGSSFPPELCRIQLDQNPATRICLSPSQDFEDNLDTSYLRQLSEFSDGRAPQKLPKEDFERLCKGDTFSVDRMLGRDDAEKKRRRMEDEMSAAL